MISAEGATIYSMIAMLLGGLLNIVLNPVLIFVCHMGVAGAAIATLLSRVWSFSIYLYYIASKKSNFHFSLKYVCFEKSLYGEIFKIGVPMLIYQFLCSAALSLTNGQAAAYGDTAVAACGVVSRILSLGGMMIMGFLKGFQPFVGYNYGAKNFHRVESTIKVSLISTSVFCILSALFLIVFRVPIMHAFSKNDTGVVQIGCLALIANSLTFITMGFQMVYSILFMGLGKAKEGGMICMGRQGLFFIPIILILSAAFGLNGIIWAQPAADLYSLVLVSILAVSENKKLATVQASTKTFA